MSTPIQLFMRHALRPLRWALLVGLLWCGAAPSVISAPRPKVFASVDMYVSMSFGFYLEVFCLADGDLVVREASIQKDKDPALRELRYEMHLGAGDIEKLGEVITKHRFFNLMKTRGSAGADDWFYHISIKPPQRKVVTKSRPMFQMEDDFIAIKAYLFSLSERAKKTPPIYNGPREENWKPPGFE